ncbi:MAG: hypothetical protein HY231_09275 [Acidobacteria bacterium]|nr:hypothetical protein [Acidobacteriota bacterium]
MALQNIDIVMEESTDLEDGTETRLRQQRYQRNLAWLEQHAAEIYTHYRGKFFCVAGQELFVADTSKEVAAQAKAAHPEDDGRIVRYIYEKKLARVYANQWEMVMVR